MHRQAHEVLPRLLAALGIERSRPGCSATATAPRSRCCTRRASRRVAGVVALAPHIFVEDDLGRQHRDARARLRRHRSARAPGALPRRPRLGVLGLERRLAAIRRSATGTSKPSSTRITLPGARGAGRGRRIRHARADPRHRAPTAENPRCSRSQQCGHSPHRDQPELLDPRSRPLHPRTPIHLNRRVPMSSHHLLARTATAALLACAALGANAQAAGRSRSA